MPIGSLHELQNEELSIEKILDLRKQYDVSTEAILIRAAKISDQPLAAFSASRVTSGPHEGKYRIDYLFPSRTWGNSINPGIVLPAGSVVHECSAIGFTAKGHEHWPGQDGKFYVECVGLPPYPGSAFPRIAGIIKGHKKQALKHCINFVSGNALSPRGRGARIIAQIVNDRTPNWGGGGFASNIRNKYPEAQSDFQKWASFEHRDRLTLGNCRLSKVGDDLYVFNMIAQHGFGPSPTPRIRYRALETGLNALQDAAARLQATVHMPKIGTGHAGGKWSIIEELINDKLVRRGLSVTVYEPAESVSSGPWSRDLEKA